MNTEHRDVPTGYAFGPFRIDLPSRQLYRGDDVLPLTGKAFETLLLLVSRPGQLVEKDELLSHVWPDTHVTEDSLTQSISVLRRTLGEDATQPRFISTVPRRGYRFVAPVTVESNPANGTRADSLPAASHNPAPSTGLPPIPDLPASPALLGRRWRTALLAGVPVAALLLVFLWPGTPSAVPNEPAIRFQLTAPQGTTLASGGCLSPDGRHLAFVARDIDSGRVRLWIRALDASEARPIAGTEGAFRPFWSPDGESVAFFADGRLKKVGLGGAPPQTLATVGYRPSRGTWSRSGVLLYADRMSPIYAVSETGDGKVTPLTTLDPSRQEVAHAALQFLPDGRHFLFSIDSTNPDHAGTFVASLDDPAARTRLLDRGAAAVAFAPPSHLVYFRDRTLMAQPFDASQRRLSGSPAPLGASTVRPTAVSTAPGGLLAFGGNTTADHLVWFDRSGRQLAALPTTTELHNAVLSPDGRQIVADGNGIWLVDLDRGAPTRIADGMIPGWSPDGSEVLFTRRSGTSAAILRQPLAGEEDARTIVDGGEMKLSGDWSRDGRTFVYVASNPTTRLDIWTVNAAGDAGVPEPFLRTPFNEMHPRVSPDGRWIAYASDETGTWEVYVQAFPAAGAKRAISVGGGVGPQWTREGRELIYLRPDGTVMAVEVTAQAGALQPEAPRALFRAPLAGDITEYRNQYTATADGDRFLIHIADESTREPINVIVHWDALINR